MHVITLRTLNGSEAGRRSLSESVDLLRSARDMVRSAARTADRPGQPVYRGGVSAEVSRYVNAIHPQPGYEAGSDLILHSRVTPDYGEHEDLGDTVHAPLARRATLALNQGLGEVLNVAQDVIGGAEITSFEQSVQRGVSANLCESVAALARGQHGVGIRISWAVVRPSDRPSQRFDFTESHAEALSSGAELLRRKSPFVDAHVSGQIVRLDRNSEEEFDGRAGVLYELDGRAVVLDVQFDMADRDDVLRAFRDGIEIDVYGDIHRSGNRYNLESPRNFLIVS